MDQMDQVDLVVLVVLAVLVAAKEDIHNNKDKLQIVLSMSSELELIRISPSLCVVLGILSQRPLVISWLEKVKILYNLNFITKSIKINHSKIHSVNHSVSPKEEKHLKQSSVPCKMPSRCFKEIQIFQLTQLVTMSWKQH